ncbi:MAG: DUF2062 domain-containing protein [Pseudomonadota bacterium]|nr:DUF2062 domain-containing protein [Pseudomonadota bacterium]
MPRRFLQRHLPPMHQVKSHRHLGFLGERLQEPYLWHLNRHSVARAVAIGLFCAYLPIPFEMVPAALLAILFRANLPISVLLVWISNPLTWIILYSPPYLLGAQLLGEPQVPLDHLTVGWLKQNMAALWLGCLIFGVAFAAARARKKLFR